MKQRKGRRCAASMKALNMLVIEGYNLKSLKCDVKDVLKRRSFLFQEYYEQWPLDLEINEKNLVDLLKQYHANPNDVFVNIGKSYLSVLKKDSNSQVQKKKCNEFFMNLEVIS